MIDKFKLWTQAAQASPPPLSSLRQFVPFASSSSVLYMLPVASLNYTTFNYDDDDVIEANGVVDQITILM